MYLANNKLN